jgi:formylglycine-generating enzyme
MGRWLQIMGEHMSGRTLRAGLGAAIVGLALAGVASATITIDTVPVGNAGNAGDTRFVTEYGADSVRGAVGYTYNIGKYEVTAGQYTAFLNAVAGVDTYGLYNLDMSKTSYGSGIARSGSGTLTNPYTYSVDANFVNRPVNLVSYGDAMRFANWLHNEQPTGAQGLGTTEDGAYFVNGATSDAALLAVSRESDWKWAVTGEDEWYKAAYYSPATSSYFMYPTSSNTAPGRDMADPLPGNNANFGAVSGTYPIDSGIFTTIAGEFQNSPSPYGTFDQGGNVWEWNEAIMYGSHRGLRGGFFLDVVYFLRAVNRGYGDSADEYSGGGFRVVQVPEPSSLGLLALGAMGMLLRRRGGRR